MQDMEEINLHKVPLQKDISQSNPATSRKVVRQLEEFRSFGEQQQPRSQQPRSQSQKLEGLKSTQELGL
jgi:hypothetical protein